MNDSNNFEYGLQDMNEMTITLTLEDDTELLCSVVAIFSAEDKDYIAMIPLDEETDKVFVYRLIRNDNDELVLENIEDESEFELAADAFDALTEDE